MLCNLKFGDHCSQSLCQSSWTMRTSCESYDHGCSKPVNCRNDLPESASKREGGFPPSNVRPLFERAGDPARAMTLPRRLPSADGSEKRSRCDLRSKTSTVGQPGVPPITS